MKRGGPSALLSRTAALMSWMLCAAALLPVAGAPVVAAAPADPLGCADRVFDPTGAGTRALATAADQLAVKLMADLHVRIERSLDGGIDARERLLEQQCAGWLAADGLRASNLLVVMVSPAERQTSIYFGEDFEDTLTTAGPQIQEYVMNPSFKDGDYAGGLIDGLASIEVAVRGGGVPDAGTPATRPVSSNSDRGTDDGPPLGLIIGLILLLSAIGIASSFSQRSGSGWGSRSRRSFSSSSSRRSSSGSSRRSRSSSRSRRSGGGGSSSSW